MTDPAFMGSDVGSAAASMHAPHDVDGSGLSDSGDQGGGHSNTPLPGATPPPLELAGDPSDPRLPCTTRIVCDTLYLSWPTTPADWLTLTATMAARQPGVEWCWGPLADGGTGPRPYVREECGRVPWLVKACRLEGYSAYGWLVTGQDAWCDLRLLLGHQPAKTVDEKDTWRVMLMIGSARLWGWAGAGAMWQEYGHDCYGCAVATIEVLTHAMPEGPAPLVCVPRPEDVKVSRLDLCCDHWRVAAWTVLDLDRFATRARGRGLTHAAVEDAPEEITTDVNAYRGDRSTTLYIGQKGSGRRFWRIYDKTIEAKHSGKLPWMEPIWAQAGWDGASPVWRAEVVHGGEWLRAHGAGTLDKLPGSERNLWEHATTSVRHVDLTSTRAKRCPTSERWRLLQEACFVQVHGVWTWTPRPAMVATDMPGLLAQSAGCLRTYEAAMLHGAAALRLDPLRPGCFKPPTIQEQADALNAAIASIDELVLDSLQKRREALARLRDRLLK